MAQINDMTVGSPSRGILKFAIPIILGYILQQMYQVIDAVIVGRWVGVNGLAAVGASTSVMFIIMGFCNGSCAGFAIPVAQAFGAKDFRKMRCYVANAIRIAFWMAIVITVVSAMLCTKILQLINTPQNIFDGAWIFLFLQFLAIPFTITYNLLSGFIRALGDSKQPFYFLIASALVNILLDVVLIMFIGMGVEGAGLATLLAQLFAASLCVWYILKHMQLLIPKGEERELDNKRISILLNNGIPMGLQFSITGIGSMMLQSANNALGTVYVASFTAAMRIKYLFTSVYENTGVAMATYCGQNLGARNMMRVKQGVKSAVMIMFIFTLFSTAVILPFADTMMLLFVNKGEMEVVSNASQLMRIACLFYIPLGFLTIFRYSIQGLGYSNLSMLSGVMEMIARIGVSLWLVPAFGWLGVCSGDPVAWVMADLFLFPAFFWLYAHLKKKMARE